MSDAEKQVRRWLAAAHAAVGATPIDALACQHAVRELKQQIEALLDDRFPALRCDLESWAAALRAQANEDLRAAEVLAASGVAPTALCMLLQMTFEKLAKAALARSEPDGFAARRVSHAAASRMVQHLKNNGRYLKFHAKWRIVLPMVVALERAHPALARGGPHLEYPWEAGGRVELPSTLPLVRDFDDPKSTRGRDVLRFARALHDRFDELFPPA